MAWSKIDLIRINAYVVKVRNGMPLDEVPEKYRDAVIAEVEELAAAYYDALDKAEEPSDEEVPA